MGYTAIREYQNNTMKKGFHYEEEKDRFVCMQGKHLEFQSTKKQRRIITSYTAVLKNNAKTVRDLPHVQQTWARFESMPVPITHLFTAIT